MTSSLKDFTVSLLGEASSSDITSLQTDLSKLTSSDLTSYEASESTRKQKILAYFVDICKKHQSALNPNNEQKTHFSNEGCSLLFQNVNNGMDHIIIAVRLSSRVVYLLDAMLEVLKKGTPSDLSAYTQTQNEKFMSQLHSSVENCKFKLDASDCLSAAGKEIKFYVDNYAVAVQKQEEEYQQSLQGSSILDLRALNLSKRLLVVEAQAQLTVREPGSPFENKKVLCSGKLSKKDELSQ